MEDTLTRDVADVDGIRSCFAANGVVAVTGVLTKAECEETLVDIAAVASARAGAEFSFRDPTTYGVLDTALNRYGVLGNDTLWSRTLLRNRCHPNVAAAYACLYGTADVVACHDRVAVMRPAAAHPEWDTEYEYPGLHLDVDPRGFCSRGFEREVEAFLADLTYSDDKDFTAENNAAHVTMGTHIQVRLTETQAVTAGTRMTSV